MTNVSAMRTLHYLKFERIKFRDMQRSLDHSRSVAFFVSLFRPLQFAKVICLVIDKVYSRHVFSAI